LEDREFEDLRCPSLGRRWSWIRRALSPGHYLELGVPARLLWRQGRRLAEQQLGPRPPRKWGCSGRRSAMGDRLAPGTGGGGGGHLTKPLVALEAHHGGGGLLLLASSRRLKLTVACLTRDDDDGSRLDWLQSSRGILGRVEHQGIQPQPMVGE